MTKVNLITGFIESTLLGLLINQFKIQFKIQNFNP